RDDRCRKNEGDIARVPQQPGDCRNEYRNGGSDEASPLDAADQDAGRGDGFPRAALLSIESELSQVQGELCSSFLGQLYDVVGLDLAKADRWLDVVDPNRNQALGLQSQIRIAHDPLVQNGGS